MTFGQIRLLVVVLQEATISRDTKESSLESQGQPGNIETKKYVDGSPSVDAIQVLDSTPTVEFKHRDF